jgi:hypothetical protein
VAFLSGFDRIPFRVLSLFALFYAVMPNLAFGMPEVDQLVKYSFAVAQTLCAALLALWNQRLNPSPLFPLASLSLVALGGVAYAYSIFVVPGMATYSSGLIPLIVIAMPLLIATRATRTDSVAAGKYLLAIFGVAAVCHLLWQLIGPLLGSAEKDFGWVFVPQGSIVLVDFVILSGLLRRRLLLFCSLGLVGLSLALRPSSELVFTTVFAAAAIVSHRLRLQRLYRAGCILTASLIFVANLAVLESGDIAQALYSVEPVVKQEALAGYSNSETRLGLISAARDEMARHSLLVGKALTGNVTVDTSVYLPYAEQSVMPIHSDFIIMIVEGGLIGYGVFAALFLGILLACSKGARLARVAGDSGSEVLLDALQALVIIFMLYMSGNPTMLLAQVTVLCCLMPVSLATFLVRAQAGFSRPWRGASLGRASRGSLC